MEIKNIFQQIESVFAKHRLIGNKNFSEDDYSLMVDFVSIICSKFLSDKHYRFDKMDYKLIFVTLVEIVKRWKEYDSVEDNEEKCGLWLHIFKTISGKDGFDQKLYSEFTNVISQMGSQNLLPVVKTGNKYYATLMMHSFAPKNNIFSFFDLCYNVFKKDLDFGFTSDDEWLCKKVADEMRTVLGGEYREEKKISIGIGSSAYSIKIGLRSFAMNEDLSDDFIEFIKDTFYQINKLFNREIINEDTRLKRYVIEWWKSKTDFDKFSNDTIRKERIPTVSKQNIAVKYIKNDNEVFLCIPSMRRARRPEELCWRAIQCGADVFVVNEDGDRPEKRALCEELGVRYVVLPRVAWNDLPARSTASLRASLRLPYRVEAALG